MKYIKFFHVESEYQDYKNGDILLPNVSYTEDSGNVYYNPYVDWSKEYLTFEITSPGIVMWKASMAVSSAYKTIYYSLNGGDWIAITSSTGGVSFNVTTGDIVRFKGTNNSYGAFSRYGYGARFNGTTAGFIVEGNIMSLINADNFRTMDALTAGTYNFYQLFYGCSGLTSARNLVFPATALTNSCYSCIFQSCENLMYVPQLPTARMASQCYYGMYAYTNALPDCTNMPFDDPQAVQSGGFRGFFSGMKVTDEYLYNVLPKNENDEYCLPVTAISAYCYDYMFDSCELLTTAPTLPATTLPSQCYRRMFMRCPNLSHVKCLATDISASSCTADWLSGVSATGTFVKKAGVTWPSGVSGIPDGWTVQEI